MRSRGFSSVVLVIVLALVSVVAAYLYGVKQGKSLLPGISPVPTDNQVVCTQDAKQCSGGSYVARQAPTCEFAPCPSDEETRDWKEYKQNEFSLKYPQEMTLTKVGDGTIQLLLPGPTQKKQTEFYDGISATITIASLGKKTLKQVVDEETAGRPIADHSPGEQGSVTPVTIINLAGVEGYSYIGYGLGAFRQIYLPYKTKYIHIGYSWDTDPQKKGYEKIMEKILSTLVLAP